MEEKEFNDLIKEYGKEIGGYLNTITRKIPKKNHDEMVGHAQVITHVLAGCLSQLLRAIKNDELSPEIIADLHKQTYEGRDEQLEIAYEKIKKVMRETIEKSKSYDK